MCEKYLLPVSKNFRMGQINSGNASGIFPTCPKNVLDESGSFSMSFQRFLYTSGSFPTNFISSYTGRRNVVDAKTRFPAD
jgi:hypothetical protein